MNVRQKIRIGDLLVQHKVIAESQLQEALAEQKRSGRKLGRVLVELGMVGEQQLLEFLARQLSVPLIDLRNERIVPAVARRLPETFARRYRALVMREDDDGARVAMADPTDIFAFDEISRLLKQPVKPALVREADLLRTIDMVYRRTEEIVSLAEELGEELGHSDYDLAQIIQQEAQTDAPVARLLQTVFEDAVQVGASDVHIEPEEGILRIRQRVDGVLQEQVIQERRIAAALVTRLKLLSGLDISERRLPQDGRFNIRVKERSIDVRLSTMPVQHGEAVVMRLLDQSAGMLNLEDLGLPAALLSRFRRAIRRPHGMILVTGPTGSGKTTTLYSALNEINEAGTKIITVEDPVEYRLPRINQVQINPRIDLTFARILRSVLRQDPDVVMIGEMRDEETVEIGLRAAMTGHLVFSTLHTNDAVGTVMRLLDMGAAGYLLAPSLEAVIAQRLLRRVCDGCARSYQPTPGERAWIAEMAPEADPSNLQSGAGCTYCNQTGYRGRIGVYEMLVLDETLSEALRRNDMDAFAREAARQPHFRPLAVAGLDYALSGLTSLSEVIRVAGSTAADLGAED